MSWQERFEKEFGKIAYTGGLKSEIKAFIQSELDNQVTEVRAMVQKTIRYRKPTHGNCCTCQTCGGDIDNCDCEFNKGVTAVLDQLSNNGDNL